MNTLCSFHDCIRYTDGQGGCDGCLNWHGVGHRFRGSDALKYKLSYKHNHNHYAM